MTEDKAYLALLFEEWKRRYDEDPEAFWSHEAFVAEPPESYGEAAATYFLWLKNEMTR